MPTRFSCALISFGTPMIIKRALVPAGLVRSLGQELEPRAIAARDLAPEGGATFQVENLARSLADEPRALGEFRFKLALAPSGISHESANHERFIMDGF